MRTDTITKLIKNFNSLDFGEFRVEHLAKISGVSQPRTFFFISKLVELGLVERLAGIYVKKENIREKDMLNLLSAVSEVPTEE